MTPSPADPGRLDRLRAVLTGRSLSGAVITNRANVRYLTGFTGSNGALVVPAEAEPSLITDGRYVDQAAAESPGFALTCARHLVEAMAQELTHGRWGVETHDLSVDAHAALAGAAGAALEALGRTVEELRVVKDDAEVAALRQACAISTEALSALFAAPLSGLTERQIARRLENLMLDLGADGVAFDTIVAVGENSAIPHHAPSDRPVAIGDLLKLDFGAESAGYHADCTRTVVLGTADRWQRDIHRAVREAQAASVATLVDGCELSVPWIAATNALGESGWLEHFTTGLGHGVGLEIHEDPYPSQRATGRIRSRTVLTIEPGIYLPGRGGVRIEDTVLVTSDSPEILTSWTTELLEIA
jgi:Xaa-Pro aminopeptidase